MIYYGNMAASSAMSETVKQELECTVREATWDDFEAICQVKRRNGIVPEDCSHWVRLWDENPFRFKHPVPLGWVLENQAQGIVGTFSNIPRTYFFNGEPVRAAIPSSWAVDRRWEPTMNEESRERLYRFWKKAVTRSFDWVESK